MKLKSDPGGAHAAATTKEKRGRRRAPAKRRGRRFAVMVCALLGAVAIGCGAYMLWEQPPERSASGLVTPKPTDGGGTETAPPEASASPSPEAGEGRYTFLLVGLDKVGYNTDTIMVGSIDTAAHSIHVVSIPRDTLVNVPYETKKINALYGAGVNAGTGGVERLKEGLRDILGFEVDFYAVVDLQAFVELVDAIGGVYYDVPVDMYYEDPVQGLSIAIPAGYQWLSGEDALKVVRFRSGYASADIGRIGTQQDFLRSVAEQLLSLGNIPNLTKLIDIFVEHVDTDLTAANLSYFARQFLLCGVNDVQFHTLPGNYADSIGGFSYVSLYLDEWLELVNAYLNPYAEQVTAANVNILTHHDGAFQSTVGYVSGGEGSFLTMEEYLARIGAAASTPAPEASDAPDAPDAPGDEPGAGGETAPPAGSDAPPSEGGDEPPEAEDPVPEG